MEALAGPLLDIVKTLVVNEAKLLSGVRGHVQSITGDMQIMDGILRSLMEAEHRNPQQLEWMKQVVDLARECEGNVELYVHRVGGWHSGNDALGCIRWIARLVWTCPARRQIAIRIRELKAKVHDVAERRTRFDIQLPSTGHPEEGTMLGDDEGEQDPGRRALLDGEPPADMVTEDRAVGPQVEWLLSPAAAAAGGGGPPLRVLKIKWNKNGFGDVEKQELADRIAWEVYTHTSVVKAFAGHMFHVNIRKKPQGGGKASYKPMGQVLRELLDQVKAESPGQDEDTLQRTEAKQQKKLTDEESALTEKLQRRLKAAGKPFLILLQGVQTEDRWERTKPALLHDDKDCPAGSAIIITTSQDYMAKSSSFLKVFRVECTSEFYYHKAKELVGSSKMDYVKPIFEHCYGDAFAVKMLLHILYVNPNWSGDAMVRFRDILSKCKARNIRVAKQMLAFCYKELPYKYRNCLLYLCIFCKDHTVRRTRLARRWIAEGLMDETDEAERCFDVLVTRGFLCPRELSAAGNIKSCTVHRHVCEYITTIAKDINFVETKLLQKQLAHHLSIKNRISLPPQASGSDIVQFLPYLATCPQWKLLKVLDLEGCTGLEKHHLKSICNIVLLRYLSLRNTDVVELPKQIENLLCLETLDIRQTNIQELAKKAIVSPMLKYFLAGHNCCASNDDTRSEESFSTVPMVSLCIGKMKDMEILSHVRVSNRGSELAGIAQLKKLRKFGVVLHGTKLEDLFRQIEKLHGCLRSLSIRIDQPAVSETPDAMMEALSGVNHLHKLKKFELNGYCNPHLEEELRRVIGEHPNQPVLKLNSHHQR